MKDGLGSMRTDIQRQSGAAVVAAGERSDRLGFARAWDWRGHLGALAQGAAAGRLETVVTTAAMNEADKSAWCGSHGAHKQDLAKWRACGTTRTRAEGDAVNLRNVLKNVQAAI